MGKKRAGRTGKVGDMGAPPCAEFPVESSLGSVASSGIPSIGSITPNEPSPKKPSTFWRNCILTVFITALILSIVYAIVSIWWFNHQKGPECTFNVTIKPDDDDQGVSNISFP